MLVNTDLQASNGFFFFQFCEVAEVMIIHKLNLARFGYILVIKLRKKRQTESF